jgi:hypothetical protein
MDLNKIVAQATAGNCSAQSKLASVYYYGAPEASMDRGKAASWAQLAAAQGDAQALRILGNCYNSGDGVEKDPVKAVELYREAAEQGDAKALFNLGNSYESGEGVSQDIRKAFFFWRKAAEIGEPEIWFRLACNYSAGFGGTSRDSVKAVFWLEKASAQGHAQAKCDLGVHCYYGNGVRKNSKKALELWSSAAELGIRDAGSWKMIALRDLLHDPYSQSGAAFEKLIDAAESGDSTAQYELGNYYLTDGGRFGPDFFQAAAWLRKAADQGSADAQTDLGVCYFDGKGVDQDQTTAIMWYRKAAEQGVAVAQYNLGHCYHSGTGVPLDFDGAIYWYERASLQGYPPSLTNLGCLYANGEGFSRSDVDALAYYILASPFDNTALQHRQGLTSALSSEQVKQASELAQQLQARIESNTGVTQAIRWRNSSWP